VKRIWAAGNLALHRDKKSALDVIADHDMELNSVLFPSRILIEFAICECPTNGGVRPGHLDVSSLMAKANAISQLGGWSDAIHLGAMPPNLTITPLGDVQACTEFESSVLMPFAKKGFHGRITTAIEDYEENFQPPSVRDASESEIDTEFEKAWYEEFGFHVNGLRKFMDAIEDIGIAREQAVFRIRKNELVSLLKSECESNEVGRFLHTFSLLPRESWRVIPEEFDETDIQPWRFRRQLSAVRRPIIQLDWSEDPELIVAPGAIRECIVHVIRSYHEGSYHEQYRDPKGEQRSRFGKAMRKWYGKRRNDRGSKFAKLVAERIAELGWNVAKVELEVRGILGYRKDPDYGDVSQFGDVDVLAWNESAKRVLVIECKHLHYHKATGEVAEQLTDYRGRMKRNGKPDDLLKHLNRLEILTARSAALCRAIGIDDGIEIEGWILFRNPVPMLYAWKDLEAKTKIATFDDIENVLAKR